MPGKVVGTWTEYLPQLRKYGINARDFPWETADDEAVMLNALTTGAVQALVLDESFLVYRASSSCDIAVVGPTFQVFDQATALSPSFSRANPSLLDEINTALIELREERVVSQLEEEFIDPPEAACKKLSADGNGNSVSFSQVAGLWVLLAGGIAVALALTAAIKLHERYTKQHLDRLGSTLKRQMSRVVTGGSSFGKVTQSNTRRRGELDTTGLDLSIGLEEGSFPEKVASCSSEE